MRKILTRALKELFISASGSVLILFVLWMFFMPEAEAQPLIFTPVTEDIQYCINAEGSNFTYEELRGVFEQNLGMISLVSDFKFLPIYETDYEPGVYNPDCKVIGFLPSLPFFSSKPSHKARAVRGVVFNIGSIRYETLGEIRAIGLHELGHNVYLSHTNYRYSIMTLYKLAPTYQRGLFWRADIIALDSISSLIGQPIAFVTANERLDISIPSVVNADQEWSVRLKHLYDDTWVTEYVYLAGDGVDMIEMSFVENDVLTILGLHWLGFDFTVVQFRIMDNGYLILIRGDE